MPPLSPDFMRCSLMLWRSTPVDIDLAVNNGLSLPFPLKSLNQFRFPQWPYSRFATPWSVYARLFTDQIVGKEYMLALPVGVYIG